MQTDWTAAGGRRYCLRRIGGQVIFKSAGYAEISFRERRYRCAMTSARMLDIGGEDGALLAGHFGDVARRHRIGPDGDAADQADVAMDVLGRVQQYALRRGDDAGPDRFG